MHGLEWACAWVGVGVCMGWSGCVHGLEWACAWVGVGGADRPKVTLQQSYLCSTTQLCPQAILKSHIRLNSPAALSRKYSGTGLACCHSPPLPSTRPPCPPSTPCPSCSPCVQEALRSRIPANSLAALIQASKPSLEESELVQQLQAQLDSLSAECMQKVGWGCQGGAGGSGLM